MMLYQKGNTILKPGGKTWKRIAREIKETRTILHNYEMSPVMTTYTQVPAGVYSFIFLQMAFLREKLVKLEEKLQR